MSAYYPPAQTSVPASRPGTATAGAILSLVMISISAVGAVILMIVGFAGLSTLNSLSNEHVDLTGPFLFGMVFGLAILAVPFAAAVMTLRNSNPWRITLVVFAFLDAAITAILALAVFNDHRTCSSVYLSSYSSDSCYARTGSVGGGVSFLIWAALAALAGILLLVNGANAFYATARRAAVVYPPQTPTITATPAGWYPVDGGQLRWWDGAAWSDHFHNPNA